MVAPAETNDTLVTNRPPPPQIAANPSVAAAAADDDDDGGEFVAASSFQDSSESDLTWLQGAALLTADCMGTGILALPHSIRSLGLWTGIVFLVLQLPINFYAGSILSHSAKHVETKLRQQRQQEESYEQPNNDTIFAMKQIVPSTEAKVRAYNNVSTETEAETKDVQLRDFSSHNKSLSSPNKKQSYEAIADPETFENEQTLGIRPYQQMTFLQRTKLDHDTATLDFIGMTQALFQDAHRTRFMLVLYYCNIFLVLGDYILVMSHAVAGLIGEEWICVPTAGLLASTLMFAVSQLRTMALLGRSASIISLLCLAIVVVQCLLSLDTTTAPSSSVSPNPTIWSKFSSLASIGFAVGSQKLFLNIRHELRDRDAAPKSLGLSLSLFGAVYVLVCLLAGPTPPSFLFDALPTGSWNRRMGGLFLWIHVVVSYAINCQAIASSMDRLFFHKVQMGGLDSKPAVRWACLTLLLSTSSYLVANAVPFFKDLVALIGALTSVPLTLLIPAIFWRRAQQTNGVFNLSFALLVFSVLFLICGLMGALDSIALDWSNHGPPFSCY